MSYFQANPFMLEKSLRKVSISNDDTAASIDNPQQTTPPTAAVYEAVERMEKSQFQRCSEQTWFRSAGKILYRLKGLRITFDNYRLLFQSFPREYEARIFAGQVLHNLSDRPLFLPGEETLQRLEKYWTGCAKPNNNVKNEAAPMLAQIHVSFYLSAQWELVKEISYLAVSCNLLNTLFAYAVVSKDLSGLGHEYVMSSTTNMLSVCVSFQNRSIKADLKSFVEGDIFSIRSDPIVGMLYCRKWNGESWPDNIDDSMAEKKTGATSMSEIIDVVYGMVRIGRRRDVTDPFIRISSNEIQRPLPAMSSNTDDSLTCLYALNLKNPEGKVYEDMCVFYTNIFSAEVPVVDFAHLFADAVTNGSSVRRVELDGKLYAMGEKQVFWLRGEARKVKLSPGICHDTKTCVRCGIFNGLHFNGLHFEKIGTPQCAMS